MAFHFKAILFVTSLSLLLHTLLLYCPVDILFKSKDPLPVNALRPQLHSLLPPANRLVLFIVSNATASDAYSVKNEDQPDLPFIRSVIRKKGRWGISYFSNSDANDDFYNNNNTRNSLPFLTGTYSDHNEDTVLRSASKVWIWCSHDGSCLNNDTGTITHLFESPVTAVTTSNASLNWMSDHIENLFLVKGNEETVGEELMKDKTIFYFNFGSADLSSIDTAMQNISSFFDSYYKDRKTTFVFTASVLGNATIESLPLMLPFVAWGAGIKNPRSKHSSLLTVHDEWSEQWGLERLERVDLDQTDIAPLLSILIGTRIPLHSLGVLPVHYIHYNKEFFAQAFYSNALQLLELVTAKEKSLHSQSLPFLFRPYHKLTQEIKHKRKTMISSYIKQRKLQEALDLSMELASLAKEAIQYYDVYHQLSVRLIMASLLLGWISYLVTILTRQDHDMEPADSRKRGLYYFIIFSFILGLGFLLWYQGMPPHFMIYFCGALLLWSSAINNCNYRAIYSKYSSWFISGCIGIVPSSKTIYQLCTNKSQFIFVQLKSYPMDPIVVAPPSHFH
uniref:GPI ethanolamine phosphate transferase 1 n=1 Tax=Amphimedon queenslandica TaxID=400682 RepID=A0A1X7VNA7_AMPQE